MPAQRKRIVITRPVPMPPGGLTSPEHLVEHLEPLAADDMNIVCVGNEMCGDDGAGVRIARGLKPHVPWTIYETHTVPESFLMKIVADRPSVVLLVDALHFGADPGAFELVDARDVAGQGPSTHGPAPLAFLDILAMFHPCRRLVLGVQPSVVDFGSAMTQPVRDAADRIILGFRMLAARSTVPAR